jgi:NADH pyrophosphatase NudC (nudix superfamily)
MDGTRSEDTNQNPQLAHMEAAITSTSEREMPCPSCGAPMPDLKGGKASICPNCGFKDSCCY